MEALEVISLIGNIITFIDFGSKIFTILKETHGSISGATEENDELEKLTLSMQNLAIDLTHQTPQVPSNAVANLLSMSVQCKELSDEILHLLQKLKSTKPGSKRESLKATWKNVWYRDVRTDLTKRLDRCQQQFNTQLVHISRSDNEHHFHDLFNQGLDTSRQLQALISRTEKLRLGMNVAKLSPEALQQIQSLVKLSDQASENEIRHKILKHIAVEGMTARFDNIEAAHEETFSWLLDPRQIRRTETAVEIQARENLLEWLSCGDGIFHISGKPGSGKSTLMKFLCQSPATANQLKVWAGEKKLVVTNFFFWTLGTPMQRSMNGLMRSLLYATLFKAPDLVRELFQEQWNSIKQRELFDISNPHIAAAFNSLIQTQDYSKQYKFVFFIDGLDEYEGDQGLMVRQLFQWVESNPQNIKICVSSRELLVFQERFAKCKKLRIHQITYHDISAHVNATLADNEDFKLSQNKPKIIHIASKIIKKAEGVFLWVKVVIRGFLEGLLAEDRLEDLEQKVDQLPRELDDLYQDLFNRMLSHTFPLDRTKAMRTLFLMTNPPFHERLHPLLLIYYSFLDESNNPSFSFGRASIDTPEDEIERRLRTSRKQLCRLCFGLLEAGEHRGDILSNIHDEIHFTHLSVAEFLSKPKTRVLIQEECQDFDACNFVLNSFFSVWITLSQYCQSRKTNFLNGLETIIHDMVFMAEGTLSSKLLSQVVEYSKQSRLTFGFNLAHTSGHNRTHIIRKKFLAEIMVLIAARMGVYEVRLATSGSIVPILSLGWLEIDPVEMMFALIHNIGYWTFKKSKHVPVLKVLPAMVHLFKIGISPNASLEDNDLSIWMYLIIEISTVTISHILEPLLRLFLLYGADSDIILCLRPFHSTSTRYELAFESDKQKTSYTFPYKAERNAIENKPLESIIQMSKSHNWKVPIRDWVELFCLPTRAKTLQLLIDRNLERDRPPTNDEIVNLMSDEQLDLDFNRGISFEESMPLISINWTD